MLTYSNISIRSMPLYISTMIDVQASRRRVKKVDFIEESVAFGLEVFKENRQGAIERIERAKNVLFEEVDNIYRVQKIFSGNNMILSDGPDVEPEMKMGFSPRRSYRVSASLEEEIGKLSDLLGIPKSFIFGVVIAMRLVDSEGVPNSFKRTMVFDIRRFVKRIDLLERDVKEILKNPSLRKEGDDLRLGDIFKK